MNLENNGLLHMLYTLVITLQSKGYVRVKKSGTLVVMCLAFSLLDNVSEII